MTNVCSLPPSKPGLQTTTATSGHSTVRSVGVVGGPE